MIRRIACAVAIAVLWAGLFGWATGLPWNTPLLPGATFAVAGSDFHAVMGAAAEEGQGLRVAAAGDDGSALQTTQLSVRAEGFPLLRYRLQDFPRTLELSLLFRRADAPADVQAVTLPWPADRWCTVDLRGVPAWHGQIIELGFAQFATGQLVPASVAFRPFRLDSAELTSISWAGMLAAQRTVWFGYAPWTLRTINALGGQLDAIPPVPFAGLAAVCAVLALGSAALILRWTKRRILHAVLIAAAFLWAVFDLGWLHNFQAKHAVTEIVYAGRTWNERERLVPNEDLTFVASQAREWLSAHAAGQRVLVAADTSYIFFRLLYEMLPQNAGALFYAFDSALPDNSLIVLYGDSQWRYYPDSRTIGGRGRSFAVEPVFSSGGARIYRTRSDAPVK